MELLAPVGSFSSFEAALQEGADAVYVGAPSLNARALTRDFSCNEIALMCNSMHEHGKKLYVAMNSLVKEDEIPLALETLSCLEKIEPDGVIVQDIGLLFLGRKYFPNITFHASTLLSVNNSSGARFLKKQGCKRVVLARELSVTEIKTIAEKSGVELEVFIHGAMCFSYSGLCMFSSLHGGKSSLRGRCVQPCRRSYTWQKGKKERGAKSFGGSRGEYLFSMNDLCGIGELQALKKAGVVSLKIEGRMKGAEYVRQTVRAYRMVLDALDKNPKEQKKIQQKARSILQASMSRKRTSGYLRGDSLQEIISPKFSGTTGLPLGKTEKVEPAKGNIIWVTLTLRESVQLGDRLRFVNEKSGERTAFSLQRLSSMQGKAIKNAASGNKVKIAVTGTSRFQGSSSLRGSLFKADVSGRREVERKARKRILEEAKSKINPDYRLLNTIPAFHDKQDGVQGKTESEKNPKWWIKVASLRETAIRLPVPVNTYVVPLTEQNLLRPGSPKTKKRKHYAEIAWELPVVIQENELNWYRKAIQYLTELQYRTFLLGHCSQALFFEEKGSAETFSLFGASTLNILNSAAMAQAGVMGFAGFLFSLETDQGNMAAALQHVARLMEDTNAITKNRLETGMLVYGRPPLFTSRLKAGHFQFGRSFISPHFENFVLDHRQGVTHARSRLPFSLLDSRRELQSMGADFFFADLSCGYMKKELATFSALLREKESREPVLSGNFKGQLM